MEISFSNTPLVVAAVLAVAVIAVQAFTALSDKLLSRLLTYLGVLLHVGMILSLLFAGAEIDLMVLAVMLSLLVYVAVHFTRYTLKKNGKEEEK